MKYKSQLISMIIGHWNTYLKLHEYFKYPSIMMICKLQNLREVEVIEKGSVWEKGCKVFSWEGGRGRSTLSGKGKIDIKLQK